MKTKTIKQSVTFEANPHEIYEMLIDSSKHSKFTGAKAEIDRREGGRFKAYDGWISGTTIKLIPDKKIIQLWRGDDWPENHYSKATFLLKKIKNGTHLTFKQSDVPSEHYEDISQGWHEHYWNKMKEILNK